MEANTKHLEALDQQWMLQAIALAKQGAGWVSPNPMVGAVIVYRGKVIARGYHQRLGGPHAERRALQVAQRNYSAAVLRQSTLYLTLSPCWRTGKKTPPCTPEIIASGIKRVVVGSVDPHPQERLRGIRAMRNAGITVLVGVAQAETDYLIRTFRKWVTTGLPFVLAKVGMTIDGRIATLPGQYYITNELSLYRVHAMRQEFDAMIVGVNTILRDNPRLTTRLVKQRQRIHHPLKIIMDSHLRSPLHSAAIDDRTILICREDAATNRKAAFAKRGAEILEVPIDVSSDRLLTGYMDIDYVLRALGDRGITSVIVEGGANIFTTFINKQAIDEFYFFIAPQLYGGTRLPFAYALDHTVELQAVQFEPLGDNILIRGYAKYHSTSLE